MTRNKVQTLQEEITEQLNSTFSSKDFVLEQLTSTESSLKSYINQKMKIYFDRLTSTLRDLVDEKYEDIHDRKYMDSSADDGSITKEKVLEAVERVISSKNISFYIQKYMQELSLIRILLSKSKNNESFQSPLLSEEPENNSSCLSCGWFLEWFHLIIVEHTRSSFKRYLKEKFCSKTDHEDEGEKKEREALLDKAILYAKAWRTRWHTFFRHLWNNPIIQALINQQIPQSTKVIGTENGFVYIVQTIAENIFQKVFYGCTHLPTIKIQSSTGSVRENSYVEILTKDEIFELAKHHILNSKKTKRYADKQGSDTEGEESNNYFVVSEPLSKSTKKMLYILK